MSELAAHYIPPYNMFIALAHSLLKFTLHGTYYFKLHYYLISTARED